MPNTDNARAAAEAVLLTEAWCTGLASVLEPLAGERASVTRTAGPADAKGMLCWEQAFSSPAGARIWICAPEPLWTDLGAKILRAAGLDPEPADIRSTWLEVVQQSAGALAQMLSKKQGSEVLSEAGKEVAAPPPEAGLAACSVSFPGEAAQTLVLGCSPELLGHDTAQPAAPAPEPAIAPGSIPGAIQKSKTFELLLDVELPVSVSFGMAELPLKDVIKLTTGSIIELNRTVSEPVEVVVNNRVIARGEVVVIDGNYGVRIQHIVSRQERLRTLR